jgi:hypothetical protein
VRERVEYIVRILLSPQLVGTVEIQRADLDRELSNRGAASVSTAKNGLPSGK